MRNSNHPQSLTESDRQAFHDLYQKHHRRVYSICFHMTQSVPESEDLTQEVFIHLFRTIGSFRGESAFTTWLHRLTVNFVLMHFRKRRVKFEFTTQSGELPVQFEADTRHPKQMRVIDSILLSEVMAKLPEGYRQAIILHDIEGLAHKEIAEIRGRSVGTSKSQVHKGRAMLRAMITQPSHSQPIARQLMTSIA